MKLFHQQVKTPCLLTSSRSADAGVYDLDPYGFSKYALQLSGICFAVIRPDSEREAVT
jgi:hypothetical protein